MKPLLKPSSHSNLYHATMRSRRSRRVIGCRDGSRTEGDRIVAWYKIEWELGFSSGFTENYSPRPP